jgi:hydroxymethylpyrimidine/phosphomethylpyrimidine kinase
MDRPTVLCFAGTDPTGGAGLAADVQTLSALGCHPAGVVTAVTAQDTTGLKQFTEVEPELVIAQARAVLEDMPVAAIKTGMLASIENVSAVATILADYPDIPVVVDPVLATNAGQALSDGPLDEALRVLLLPRARIVTPNTLEARVLAPGGDNLDACAQLLLSAGAEFVLLTGTHEPGATVVHRLYGAARCLETWEFARLPGEFHGSGCTLAAALAAHLAHGLDPLEAAMDALGFTYRTLQQGLRAGMGQRIPDRFFWAGGGDVPPPRRR